MFTLQGNFQLNFEVIGISYLCPSWCPLIIAIHETKFEIEEENKIENGDETAFETPIIFGF